MLEFITLICVGLVLVAQVLIILWDRNANKDLVTLKDLQAVNANLKAMFDRLGAIEKQMKGGDKSTGASSPVVPAKAVAKAVAPAKAKAPSPLANKKPKDMTPEERSLWGKEMARKRKNKNQEGGNEVNETEV